MHFILMNSIWNINLVPSSEIESKTHLPTITKYLKAKQELHIITVIIIPHTIQFNSKSNIKLEEEVEKQFQFIL